MIVVRRWQLVQNRAARIVLGVGRRVSAEPLLRELHWLPIIKRIQFKTAILTFKVVTTKQPSYLSSLLVPYVPTRNLRSMGNSSLIVPKIDSVFQSRAFSYAAPHLWNSLPGSLRSLANLSPCLQPSQASSFVASFTDPCCNSAIPNFSLFKRQLKTYLFDNTTFLVG